MDALPNCRPTTVRFRDIFAASETEDEQNTSLASVLEFFRREWPGGFTAGELRNYLSRGEPAANDLRAAIEMAAHRPIKHASATELTWRLKALTDTPCDVDGTVLALRYTAGHNGGRYEVRKCR